MRYFFHFNYLNNKTNFHGALIEKLTFMYSCKGEIIPAINCLHNL